MSVSEEADKVWLAIEDRDIDGVREVFEGLEGASVTEICLHEARMLVLQRFDHRDSLTCLHYAAKRGFTDAVKSILTTCEELNVNVKTSAMEWTPLHYAAFGGNIAVIKKLIKAGSKLDIQAKDGKCPVHIAVIRGFQRVAAYLVSKNCPVNERDRAGNTLLHYCVDEVVWEKTGWSEEQRGDVVEFLLMHGANVDLMNNAQESVLHSAVKNNVDERTLGYIITAALKNPGGLDTPTGSGHTTLSLARDIRLVSILLDNGTSVNAAGKDGRTPLHQHIQDSKITEILLKKGGDVMIADSQGKVALHVALQVSSPDLSIIKLLLQSNSACLHVADENGYTPLHVACATQYAPIIHYENLGMYGSVGKTVDNDSDPVVELLLEKQAEVEAVDRDGKTPLLTALSYGHLNKANLLALCGADVYAVDKRGRSPKTMASKWFQKATSKPAFTKADLDALETEIVDESGIGKEAAVAANIPISSEGKSDKPCMNLLRTADTRENGTTRPPDSTADKQTLPKNIGNSSKSSDQTDLSAVAATVGASYKVPIAGKDGSKPESSLSTVSDARQTAHATSSIQMNKDIKLSDRNSNSSNMPVKINSSEKESISVFCCFVNWSSKKTATPGKSSHIDSGETEPEAALSRQVTLLQDDLKLIKDALEDVAVDQVVEEGLQRQVTDLKEDVKTYTSYLEKVTQEGTAKS